MLQVFQAESLVLMVVDLALLVVKLWAFISSLTYSSEAYNAANKLTKPAWTIILGIGVAVQLIVGGFGILNMAFIVAAFVYLADVRPALSSLTRRR